MIAYISEQEYEKRFSVWAKWNKPLSADVQSRLAMEIKCSAEHIARIYFAEPSSIAKHIRGMKKSAEIGALRSTFSNKFVAHPTGMDKNAIAFCGEWREGQAVKS